MLMIRQLIAVMVAMTFTGFAYVGGAGAASVAVADPSVPVSVPDLREPTADVEACARTSSGRRLACLTVHADGDGRADGALCAYDDVLGLLGWGLQRELSCVETTRDWGFVSAPGVCERSLGIDKPHACVNGRDECLLWVMSVRVVCRAE